METCTENRKYILSIDGGGVRGIIALHALAELEAQLATPARELFSFMAGTSTGGIIISSLALGIPAQEIIHLYREMVGKIFRGGPVAQSLESLSYAYAQLAGMSWIFKDKLNDFANFWDAAARFRGPLYSSKNIARYYGEAIRAQTGCDPEQIVLDDLPVDILITAQGVRDGHTWYFVKSNPRDFVPHSTEKKYPTTGELKLVDCVTGSASAPTYFTPWPIDACVGPDGRRIGEVADGGVTTANNPVYQACVEAFQYNHARGYTPANTTVISLGTGRRSEARPLPMPDDLIEWLKWSFEMLLESPGRQQLEFVDRHYQRALLYRIDIDLDTDIDLGDAHAIGRLEEHGRRLAATLRQPGEDWRSMIVDCQKNRWLFRKQRAARVPGSTLATV